MARRKSSIMDDSGMLTKMKTALKTFNPLYWVLVIILLISCILFF